MKSMAPAPGGQAGAGKAVKAGQEDRGGRLDWATAIVCCIHRLNPQPIRDADERLISKHTLDPKLTSRVLHSGHRNPWKPPFRSQWQ